MIFRVKIFIAKILTLPFVGSAIAVLSKDRISYRGMIIDTQNQYLTPSTKAEIFWGIYEGAEARFIQKYLTGDLGVIELGASIGIVSCCIKKKLNGKSKLIAVEAHPGLAK